MPANSKDKQLRKGFIEHYKIFSRFYFVSHRIWNNETTIYRNFLSNPLINFIDKFTSFKAAKQIASIIIKSYEIKKLQLTKFQVLTID